MEPETSVQQVRLSSKENLHEKMTSEPEQRTRNPIPRQIRHYAGQLLMRRLRDRRSPIHPPEELRPRPDQGSCVCHRTHSPRCDIDHQRAHRSGDLLRREKTPVPFRDHDPSGLRRGRGQQLLQEYLFMRVSQGAGWHTQAHPTTRDVSEFPGS